MKGIEPSFSAWEADVLPLNYTRDQGVTLSATPAERKSEATRILGYAEAQKKMMTVPRRLGNLSPMV